MALLKEAPLKGLGSSSLDPAQGQSGRLNRCRGVPPPVDPSLESLQVFAPVSTSSTKVKRCQNRDRQEVTFDDFSVFLMTSEGCLFQAPFLISF